MAAAAAGASADASIPALDALVAADLVRPAAGRTFRFRHPLVHRAVLDAVAPGRRLRGHERAAATLAARGAEPGVRAYHLEQCAQPGDEAALAVLVAAARAATDTAPATAAHWYGVALRLLPHDAAARRAPLLAAMGSALASAGRLTESRAAIDEAIALLDDATPASRLARARLIADANVVDVLLGAWGAAEARLRRAGDAPAALRPRLLLQRASIAFFQADAEGAADWARQAVAALERDPGAPPVQLAAATAQQALSVAMTGGDAGELIEDAARRLAAVDDDALATQVDAAWSVGGTLGQIERYRAAVEVMRRGARVARAARQGHLFLHFHTLMAIYEPPLLELDAAREHAEAAEEGARLQGLAHELAFALTQRARVLAARGELAEAQRAAAESDELYASLEHATANRASRAHNAIVRHAADPERQLAALQELGGPGLERINPTAVTALLLAATRAALALGRTGAAEELARRALAVGSATRLPASTVRGMRARAEVLAGGGDAGAAAALAREALAHAERHDLPQEALGARLLLGGALLGAGEREEGIAALQRVAADAGRAGAAVERDAAGRELRRAGVRVSMQARRAEDAAGRSGLTEREAAVAGLVAAGRTNKQVAATLFLSEKTVERHLSRVYAKLGVRSRTELGSTLR